jgi:hypothetical protein
MAGTGGVGVRQFVDDEDPGTAYQGGVDVELAQRKAAIVQNPGRKALQPFGEAFGVGTAVRFDPADHDVGPLAFAGLGRFEHGVGLPHPRRRAEINL